VTRRLPCEVHVFRSVATGRWIVRALVATERGYRTQADAARAGIRQAKQRRVDLVIHGRNGRIRSKDRYGNESPTLDTEH
jgi:hypothetical protein